MANCSEAMQRLYEFLDRELTPEEQRVVQSHLDRCPPCVDLFRFEANILTFVGSKCRETAAPPELRKRVERLCHG